MSAAQRLDEVFGLPEGSEVYVLNDFKSSAYDAVRLFETLGLNQFRYIPFYPGALLVKHRRENADEEEAEE